ncbi:MAG: tripartite tricarboxylate transporter substrate binding protein [Rhodospirillales bacterium]|nr:tripartite tricarboxylate transporter substrate binding protein [Rhodospirillales bacterium]
MNFGTTAVKGLSLVVGALTTFCLTTTGFAADSYPKSDIKAVIPFGAGGGTDTLARAIVNLAEKELGQAVIVQNKPGATGAVATEFVRQQPADGYTILIAAENQNLYRTTGLSKLSFDDFEPVILLGEAYPVVVTLPDAKWKSISEVLDEVDKNPKSVKVMNTGPVGISGVVTAMLGKDFTLVPYRGEGPGLAGLLGGHVDIGIVSIGAVIQHVETGNLKVLSVISDKRLKAYPDWPALGEERPEYKKYLPWGPYYGVYAKKGTPQPVLAKLQNSFKKAWSSDKYQKFLDERRIVPLGLMGEAAVAYQKRWESVTTWLLFEANAASDPAAFGIPRL